MLSQRLYIIKCLCLSMHTEIVKNREWRFKSSRVNEMLVLHGVTVDHTESGAAPMRASPGDAVRGIARGK